MTETPADTETPIAKSVMIRKLLLYGVLVIMLCALAYDYSYARPAVNAAYDRLIQEHERVNRSNGLITSGDVIALMNREPDATRTDGRDFVQEYHFAGGIPGRPHKLFAVFVQTPDGELIFQRHHKFVYESTSEVVPIPEVKVYEAEELLLELDVDEEGGVNRYFAMYDQDKDGFLRGVEITPPAEAKMLTLDTNQDQQVSLEELRVYMRRVGDIR